MFAEGASYEERANLPHALNTCLNPSPTKPALKLSLACMQGLWVLFPVTFFIVKVFKVGINAEEWLWTTGDFFGKVMFSTSLMYGEWS
jgi:hypothetical protein